MASSSRGAGRGGALAAGERLASADGSLVVAVAALPETLTVAETADPLLLARACYHLGNRQVALAIAQARLAWQHDHVLDATVAGLGLAVRMVEAPFEPEAGAYSGGHGYAHGGGHEHDHGHHHDHDNDGRG